MKQLLLNYYQLLKKDKLFLVWNVSLISLIWTSAFLAASLYYFLYTLIVNVVCSFIFLDNVKKAFEVKEKKYKEESEQLNFWMKEMTRIIGEFAIVQQDYTKAEANFEIEKSKQLITKAEELHKSYSTAAFRYAIELRKVYESYGMKVELKYLNNPDQDNYYK